MAYLLEDLIRRLRLASLRFVAQLALIPALSVGFTAVAGAADRSPEMLKLRLGLASSPAPALPNSVLWLAKDLGFYNREGLEVELNEFKGTPLVIAGMIAGDIDVGNVSTSDVIRLVATKSQAMRAIHSPDARLYFLIAATHEIKSVTALQGKTFAVARIGSLDHSLSLIALKAFGRQPG